MLDQSQPEAHKKQKTHNGHPQEKLLLVTTPVGEGLLLMMRLARLERFVCACEQLAIDLDVVR